MAEKNSKINDLIFKELIKRGYSIEDGKRIWNVADSKLWYLTPEQAKDYLKLENDPSYQAKAGRKQFEDLVKNNIKELKRMIGNGPINVIDLGCGDGEKGKLIVSLLKDDFKIRYCPIDISSYMVEQAMKTFSDKDIAEVVSFQYNISDFENLENITPLLKKGEFKKNVILLLGNTLGNFEINELLYEIRSSMSKNDVFVVDTALDDLKQEERVRAYKNNPYFYKFLIHVPLYLGLKEEDLEFDVQFRNSRIELSFILKRDRKITFQNKTVDFNKGDKIIVTVAYKYKKEEFLTFLTMYFDEKSYFLSEDKSKILAFCKR